MVDVLVRDPETMPLDCGLYTLLQRSRDLKFDHHHGGLGVFVEPVFVQRTQSILNESPREYRHVLDTFRAFAMQRGYDINWGNKNLWFGRV